jgi:SAM-dependent methyltransferase
MARSSSPDRLNAPLQGALAQVAAAGLALVPLAAGLEMTAAQWAVVQGAVAMRIALFAGAATWWLGLHVLFAPAAVWAHQLALAPAWWAAAAAGILLVFGATFRTRVPLFISARAVRGALTGLLDRDRGARMIDLGCGLGHVITAVKRARPDCECDGVELAWLPYLVSRLRALRAGCRVERRDLMSVDLSRYDLVYAFLSPAPMQALWQKARREMRPGTRLVSLAFDVPGVAPDAVIAVTPKPRHRLYVWTM